MNGNDLIFDRVAEALLGEYSCVYYVDSVTCEYSSFSNDSIMKSLGLCSKGSDFFKDLAANASKYIYEEDKHIFLGNLDADKFISFFKGDSVSDIVYRLLINGTPVWYSLRLIKKVSGDNGDCFILGVTNVDEKIRIRQETERLSRERRIFNQIAESLASYYDTIYYVDSDTDEYMEFSSTTQYNRLDIPKSGSNFFVESGMNIEKYIHPDDMIRILNAVNKTHILRALENRKLYTAQYRLMIDGEYRYTRLSVMWASDKKHFIIGVEDINDRINRESARKQLELKAITYTQIISSLAYTYEAVYYLDLVTDKYLRYSLLNEKSILELVDKGDDFYSSVSDHFSKIIHKEDHDVVNDAIKKDNIIKLTKNGEPFSLIFRRVTESGDVYMSLRVALAEDKRHVIIGIADIDEQVRRENETRRELITANQKAMIDELTGVKNMNAYQEMELSLQRDIDSGKCMPFAVLICDLNNLKFINDSFGHKAGDEYIRSSCNMICEIFSHSPVFRVGGDEFVVILRGSDYSQRVKLFAALRNQVLENCRKTNAPVIASGIAEFDYSRHSKVSDVFQNADNRMYENKKQLKRSTI